MTENPPELTEEPEPEPKQCEGIDSLSREQQILITKELLRKTPEYQVCWELELWKKQQKHLFQQSLKKQKSNNLRILKSQYSKKTEDLESSYSNKQKSLKNLENSINLTISKLQKKEATLKNLENSLKQKKKEMEAQISQKLKELSHSKKLIEEKCAHKISLLQETMSKRNTELSKAKESHLNLEKQIELLRKQNSQYFMKIGKLQNKINTLNVSESLALKKEEINQQNFEISKLKGKLQDCIGSKNRYKIELKKEQKKNEILKRKFEKRIQMLVDKVIILQNQQIKKEQLNLKKLENRISSSNR